MKHLVYLVFLLISLQSLSAQDLNGRVLHAVSGRPVPGASVQLLGSRTETKTNEEGYFSVPVAQLPVRLQVYSQGFEPLRLVVEDLENERTIFLSPLSGTLEEVVVRSTLVPRDLIETPAAVTVLEEQALQRNNQTNLLPALSNAPGLFVHQGALNTNKMSIRGIGARSQYATTRIKAYFMGIPLTTAEGATTLDDIPLSSIGRVEVIRGPVSSMYGAGLGGVINLYPPESPEKGTRASAAFSQGSFGMIKKDLHVRHASEEKHLWASYQDLSSDGYRENGAYSREGISIFANQGPLSLLGQFVRLKAFIPSALNRKNFEEQPSTAAASWAAARGYESYDKGLLGLSYAPELGGNLANTTSVYMNFRKAFEPRPFDILREDQIATGVRTVFRQQDLFGSLPSDLSFGGEYYTEWYDTATFDNLHESVPGQGSHLGQSLSNNSQQRNYYNLFAQAQVEPTERLQLKAGININSTSYSLEDLYVRDSLDQSGQYRFATVVSPRFGAVYELAPQKNLYSSISHGFSTPTVAETLTPEGLINTRLKPETGINYELGFKGHFLNNRFYGALAVFSIQVENLLVAERVAEDQYIGRNAGKTDHNGMELELRYRDQLTADLEISGFLNGALNDFRFDRFREDGKEYSGNLIPAVPQENLAAGFDLSYRSLISLLTSMQYQGRMALNDANTGFTENYTLLNLKMSYNPQWFSNWEISIFAGINNLLDTQYAASIVPNAVGFGGSAPRYYYPGRPRAYYTGLQVGYLF